MVRAISKVAVITVISVLCAAASDIPPEGSSFALESDEVCSAQDAAECGTSLRQLRGELMLSAVQQHSDASDSELPAADPESAASSLAQSGATSEEEGAEVEPAEQSDDEDGSTRWCVADKLPCWDDKSCCSGKCVSHFCTAGPLKDVCMGNKMPCVDDKSCCSGKCVSHFCGENPFKDVCVADKLPCVGDKSCCSGKCVSHFCGENPFKDVCVADKLPCVDDKSCCSGKCVSHFCGENPFKDVCIADKLPCWDDKSCCSGKCKSHFCSASESPVAYADLVQSDDESTAGLGRAVVEGNGMDQATSEEEAEAEVDLVDQLDGEDGSTRWCVADKLPCWRDKSCCSGKCVSHFCTAGPLKDVCMGNKLPCLRDDSCCSGRCVSHFCSSGPSQDVCMANELPCVRHESCCSGRCVSHFCVDNPFKVSSSNWSSGSELQAADPEVATPSLLQSEDDLSLGLGQTDGTSRDPAEEEAEAAFAERSEGVDASMHVQ